MHPPWWRFEPGDIDIRRYSFGGVSMSEVPIGPGRFRYFAYSTVRSDTVNPLNDYVGGLSRGTPMSSVEML